MFRGLTFLLLSVLGPPLAPEPLVALDDAPGDPDDEDCSPPEPGFITIDTVPWTVVYVDGIYAGSTPLFRHKLPPGDHTLTLINQGRKVLTHEDVVVDEGRTRKVKLLLLADATDTALNASDDAGLTAEDCFIPPDETSFLSVNTSPWTRVFLDGRSVGSTPLFELPMQRGDHVVRLVRDDGSSSFARFTAASGETVRMSLNLAALPPTAP